MVRLADEEPTVPAALAERTSLVRMYTHARIEGERRVSATVLAIDPATLDRAAYWDATFSDASFRDVLDRLAAPPEGGRIPAVVVGSDVTGTARVAIVGFGTPTFDVERLGDVEAFPGMRRPEPTVIVAATHLEGLDLTGGRTEAWIRGDRDDTLATLVAAGTGFSEERRLTEVADSASFLTVSWTFGFMQSLGISAGLLVLGGVAVYLDARRRDRLLGYAFMRRMGLPPGLAPPRTGGGADRQRARRLLGRPRHRAGGRRGSPTSASTRCRASAPIPLLRPALVLGGALAAVSLLLTVLAAVLAQRRIDRDDPVEVLRAGV